MLAVVVVAAGQTPAGPGGGGRAGGAPAAQAPTDPTVVGRTPEGFTLRLARKTNHISNYNESVVPSYTLPDPLITFDGRPVRTAADWKARRAEIVKAYEEDVYGRVPANAPKVRWEVASTDPAARAGAILRRVVGTIGMAADGPKINLNVYTPAGAAPSRAGDSAGELRWRAAARAAAGATPGAAAGQPAPGQGRGNVAPGEPPVAAEILARGWGYATVGYADIQPDRANTFTEGVIGTTLASGQTKPAPGDWGTISAWTWGISRIIDYFETDPFHRREAGRSSGLLAPWQDSALGLRDGRAHRGGVLRVRRGNGSSLARRDFGETVDDMAQNYHWQFNSRFQQWVGRWNDMPVDAHMLIALSAPRPVFITGGTTDQWSDPKGEFLAEVAASPSISSWAGKASALPSCRPSTRRSPQATSPGITTPAATC